MTKACRLFSSIKAARNSTGITLPHQGRNKLNSQQAKKREKNARMDQLNCCVRVYCFERFSETGFFEIVIFKVRAR